MYAIIEREFDIGQDKDGTNQWVYWLGENLMTDSVRCPDLMNPTQVGLKVF